MQAEAWQTIPGVSEWVMATIRWGYTLQIARRPLCFRCVLATTVRSEDAQVNRSSSPERVRLLKRRWPATYSRSQTLELRSDEKVVQDDHFEIDPLANMPRGLVHYIGSERRVFYIQVAPHQRRFLRFALYCILYWLFFMSPTSQENMQSSRVVINMVKPSFTTK